MIRELGIRYIKEGMQDRGIRDKRYNLKDKVQLIRDIKSWIRFTDKW